MILQKPSVGFIREQLETPMSEKIQKVLANAGIGSRRQIEGWISEGRITINGRLATLGDRMTYHDKVEVDGREVKLIKSQQQKSRVLLYHKPEGEMCTRSDPEGRPTIFQSLPYIRNSRWICVGRLDFNTAGLMLITNNGELANQLMHPSTNIEREYAVRIRGDVDDDVLASLKKGIRLEDGIGRFASIVDAGGTGSNHWFHVIVKEGRNRLVRRMWEAVGFDVSRLIRVRFGPVFLPAGLRRGKHMELDEEEVVELAAYCRRQESDAESAKKRASGDSSTKKKHASSDSSTKKSPASRQTKQRSDSTTKPRSSESPAKRRPKPKQAR